MQIQPLHRRLSFHPLQNIYSRRHLHRLLRRLHHRRHLQLLGIQPRSAWLV
jgi:hypothetical protein